MVSSRRGLSGLQQDLLREFFARNRGFALTGGGALIGFHYSGPNVDAHIDEHGAIRVHSLREIAANKLCALLGRGEIRDLVDLRAILERGLELRAVLADAERKDGGMSAAALAWVLDSLRIGSEAELPGGVSAGELERFRSDLVRRLRDLALPSDS